MRKLFFLAALSVLFLTSCETEKDPFLISSGNIGILSKDIKLSQLDSLYAMDSVVFTVPDPQNFVSGDDVEIFDKEGNLLLVLHPFNAKDMSSTINNLHVIDKRFVTEKGLGVGSTFKAVKDNYTISSVQSTLSSVVVFLEDSDIYITIDKQELPEDARYSQNKIEATQIPDEATFKYFMIGWDKEEASDSEDKD